MKSYNEMVVLFPSLSETEYAAYAALSAKADAAQAAYEAADEACVNGAFLPRAERKALQARREELGAALDAAQEARDAAAPR
jgi:hypothetical protein